MARKIVMLKAELNQKENCFEQKSYPNGDLLLCIIVVVGWHCVLYTIATPIYNQFVAAATQVLTFVCLCFFIRFPCLNASV